MDEVKLQLVIAALKSKRPYKTYRDIQQEFHINYTTINLIISENEIQRKTKSPPADKNLVIQSLRERKTYEEIRQIFHLSKTTIAQLIKENNIQRRRKSKTSLQWIGKTPVKKSRKKISDYFPHRFIGKDP